MPETEPKDYSKTLNLMETSFPMRANLATREPEQVKWWAEQAIYKKIQEKNLNRPLFVMPDGPPYANASIHVGHCLNKILKDFVIKYRAMTGHRAAFIPGWDCHGLPIEHAVAKELGSKRREKTDAEIRSLCRAHADKYMNLQRDQFKRLGVLADWDHPYRTMDFSYEAQEIHALANITEKGYVYRGEKPVHWCWFDGTALAEAEVEYADRKDPSIYVKFEVKKGAERFQAANKTAKVYFIIWTTTPWTLPANLAIAVGADYGYGLYKVGDEFWVLAEALAPFVEKAANKKLELRQSFKGRDLGGTKTVDSDFDGVICRHPFIDRDSYVLLGSHVTLDAGTGCVHTAPGHGQEDYLAGLQYGLKPYNPVDGWGKFTNLVPEYQGVRVFDANPKICDRLRASGHLVAEESIGHSFPHCWRCHNPVIFRATSQWFISMDNPIDGASLRQRALAEIKKVKWVPSWGENRITSMVENRPDWCISRQRLWGVPIPVLYCENCEKDICDPTLMRAVAEHIEKEGLEAWHNKSAQEWLGPAAKCAQCGHEKFRKGSDILDVWFDSGVCHLAVQRTRDGMAFPADLYLEGSDQHRGWFQSSLMTATAMDNQAPFRTVLTHGFVNDAQGRKMSKSLGNVLDPLKFMEKSGAEILRLWTAFVDYSNDLQAGQESFDRVTECYRRVRNTCRYILGVLSDFDPTTDSTEYNQILAVDCWALARFADFVKECQTAYETYDFSKIYHSLQNYCVVDLSAIYLDILKDRLYTWKKTDPARRSAQTALFSILKNLVSLMAPILSFLSEEVYRTLPGAKVESVFLTDFPQVPKQWSNQKLVDDFSKIFEARSLVTKRLEEARQSKQIGASLEAQVQVTVPEDAFSLLDSYKENLASYFIVSQVKLIKGGQWDVMVSKAEGEKCERCWNFSKDVNQNLDFPRICQKCVRALT